MNLPKELEYFRDVLSWYRELLYDDWEPIAWWFKITSYLWDDKFNKLGSSLPEWFYLDCLSMWNRWVIAKYLTPKEAVEKYWKITKVITWPRWGMKYTFYWDKKFCVKKLNWVDKEDNPDLFDENCVIEIER
jgi:hypothetical protein